VRVLYSFPHTLGRAGIGTTASHQISGLIEQGVSVDIVCTSSQREFPGARRKFETLKIGGHRVPHRAIGVYRAYAYHDWHAARILRRLHREVDLVHCWPAGCLRTFEVARQLSVTSFREAPSAHTRRAYEDAARQAMAVGVDLPSNHHHQYDAHQLERELREFAAADYLLVPSEYVERTFVEQGHAPGSLIRHRYGFAPSSFGGTGPPRRPDGEGLTAVFVGRGEPNKGLHHALRAWVDSGAGENGRLLICGEILGSYRTRIRELLSHASVGELGFVENVGEVMASADVLLLPSVTLGSALVTYDAQAAGCALLVSDAAGAPCTHMEQGLVHNAGDVAALTEHLRQLKGDRKLLRKLQKGAMANATGLTWYAAGKRLVEAYQEGLERFQGR
jgi:glycosyltransferase involved in cell wall biosynthesis